ncbi:MAG: ferritin [Chitinispirillaceae bacterium]|jgi:ferritin|nr:ferritin [Chitinispirillaceae bacterium]
MLSTKMVETVNSQINKEIYSAYLYLAMASHAEAAGYKGAAVWFKVQYHEEMVHGMKFYEYLVDQGAPVQLLAIAEPAVKYTSLLNLFKETLAHELTVTASINNLMDLAITERDHASQALLQWYITEQVEEEKNATEIVQTLKMIGDNTSAQYLYDKELGMRMVTVPTDFSKGISAALGAP